MASCRLADDRSLLFCLPAQVAYSSCGLRPTLGSLFLWYDVVAVARFWPCSNVDRLEMVAACEKTPRSQPACHDTCLRFVAIGSTGDLTRWRLPNTQPARSFTSRWRGSAIRSAARGTSSPTWATTTARSGQSSHRTPPLPGSLAGWIWRRSRPPRGGGCGRSRFFVVEAFSDYGRRAVAPRDLSCSGNRSRISLISYRPAETPAEPVTTILTEEAP